MRGMAGSASVTGEELVPDFIVGLSIPLMKPPPIGSHCAHEALQCVTTFDAWCLLPQGISYTQYRNIFPMWALARYAKMYEGAEGGGAAAKPSRRRASKSPARRK